MKQPLTKSIQETSLRQAEMLTQTLQAQLQNLILVLAPNDRQNRNSGDQNQESAAHSESNTHSVPLNQSRSSYSGTDLRPERISQIIEGTRKVWNNYIKLFISLKR